MLPMESNAVSLWSRKRTAIIVHKRQPVKQWPAWATAISLLKNDADKGVGDTVERIIGKAASATYKAWYKSVFGKSCGCGERKVRWNKDYPYLTLTVS